MQSIELPGNARPDLREHCQLRPIEFLWNIAPSAEGSILFKCGQTQVICAVTVEENVPRWMKEQGISGGWLTAEYSMLPYSTQARKQREVAKGKLEGRTQEIQRLIGRALRAAVDLQKLGPRTLYVDCDVVSADGGTRTTSITGAYLALCAAIDQLLKRKILNASPILHAVAATSVGIYRGRAVVDLCYTEDKDAEVDMNLVMTDDQRIIEIQASGEESTFSKAQFDQMLELGQNALQTLFEAQKQAWQQRSLK